MIDDDTRWSSAPTATVPISILDQPCGWQRTISGIAAFRFNVPDESLEWEAMVVVGREILRLVTPISLVAYNTNGEELIRR